MNTATENKTNVSPASGGAAAEPSALEAALRAAFTPGPAVNTYWTGLRGLNYSNGEHTLPESPIPPVEVPEEVDDDEYADMPSLVDTRTAFPPPPPPSVPWCGSIARELVKAWEKRERVLNSERYNEPIETEVERIFAKNTHTAREALLKKIATAEGKSEISVPLDLYYTAVINGGRSYLTRPYTDADGEIHPSLNYYLETYGYQTMTPSGVELDYLVRKSDLLERLAVKFGKDNFKCRRVTRHKKVDHAGEFASVTVEIVLEFWPYGVRR